MSFSYVRDIEVVDQRISKVKFDWGIEQRPLWRTLAELPPALAVRWVDRYAPYESISAEWAMCLAYESAFRLEPPRRAQWIRALYAELQRVLWSCRYFALVFRAVDDRYREQVLWALVDSMLSFQQTMTGGRVLPQILRIGGVAKDMTLGDFEKVLRMCREVEERVQIALGDLEEDQLLVQWFERGLCIDRELLVIKDITGPIVHASGEEADLRMSKPYGPYDEIKTRTFRPEKERSRQGRPIDRIRSVRFQMYQSLQQLQTIVKNMPDGPYELGVEVPAELPEMGSWHSAVEAPSGAIHCDLRRGSVLLRSTTASLAEDLDTLFTGVEADDFELSLASLGLDFSQGGLVESSS